MTNLPKVQRVWMIGVDVSELRSRHAHLEGGAHGKAVGLNGDCQRLCFFLHFQNHSESHVAVAARRETHQHGQPAQKSLHPLK